MFTDSLVTGVTRRFKPVGIDAAVHPAETYYADFYLQHIRSAIGEQRELRILDAGCGTGRLLMHLARDGHALVGIDQHRPSLRLARQHLDDAGLDAQLIEDDLLAHLKKLPADRFHLTLAIESLYINPRYQDALAELHRVTAPGGHLLITHRPRHFLLLQAVARRNFDDAQLICSESEGRLRKGLHRVYYNWQTRDQIKALYRNLGAQLHRLVGIGICSGFGTDPLAPLCNPAELDPAQRASLGRIESTDDPDLTMAARYVLAIAQKAPFG